jgi:hypothetical protein
MMKKSMKSLMLCGIYILVVYSVTTACPPPNCGPCASWNSQLQQCVNNCTSNQCCTTSGCATLNTNWQTESPGLNVEVDSSLVNAVANAIGEIPGMPAITLNSTVLAYSTEKKECCKDTGGIAYERCATGMGAIGGQIDRIEFAGIHQSITIQTLGFGVSVHVDASAYIEGTVGATCSVGKYANECTGASCNTGSVSIGSGVTMGVAASAGVCAILFGTDHCIDVSASASGTVAFEGSASLNSCGNCNSGLSGGIHLTQLSVTATASANGASATISKDFLQ